MTERVSLTEEEWRERLTPEQYAIVRGKGTEPPFTGTLLDQKEPGLYRCVACEAPLFQSTTKYESGSGWPSFYEPVSPEAIRFADDSSHGMVRTEIMCARCDAHLGHVFPDGPQPAGERYCVNSLSLDFDPDEAT